MKTTKILQNSWHLMLRYRALWVFGVILALTTVSFGSSLWLRSDEEPADRTLVNWEISPRDQAWVKENFGLDLPLRYSLKVDDLVVRLDDPSLTMGERTRLLRLTATIMAVLLVLLVVTLVLRYTAEAALITMVDHQQHGGKQYSARQGWSLGFSTSALKLFLIDLVVYPLLLMISLLLFLLALLPVLIAIQGTLTAITVGVLLMISFTLVSAAALIVMWIAGMITVQLARRASCLEGLGVFASIWQGVRLMRAQLRGVGLTWLVMLGLELVYPILVAPVGILLAAAGLTVSGLLALLLGTLLALVVAQTTAWTVALIVGVVLLMLVVGIPITLMGGLREVFKSSAWTLTFRKAVSMHSSEKAPVHTQSLPQAATA